MKRIVKLHEKTTYRFDCKQHRAVLEMTADELHFAGRWHVAYECPICGRKHRVSTLKLDRVEYYRHEVDADDPSLPVNSDRLRDVEKRVNHIERVPLGKHGFKPKRPDVALKSSVQSYMDTHKDDINVVSVRDINSVAKGKMTLEEAVAKAESDRSAAAAE